MVLMDIGIIIKRIIPGTNRKSPQPSSPTKPKNTFEQDIYFTSNFHAKAKEWGLTEEHARLAYYEGDAVKGKENMKVMRYKGEEIGIYVFRDRQTNQPVVTSIWKHPPLDKGSNDAKSRR